MSDFPYPGLRPYKRDEVDIFFGRESHTDQLIKQLNHTHFIAVVGPSGCGKSSLVCTGLLAALEGGLMASAGGNWQIAELRPGNKPFARLAEACLKNNIFNNVDINSETITLLQASLRRGPKSVHEQLTNTPLPDNTTLLLLVDQFEEIFRYYQQGDKNEAAVFVKLLLTSAEHPLVYVVITMRSDFIGDCATFYGLPEAVNQGLFLTPRLTREQLQEAIELPAGVFGGEVEVGLVNKLLNEVGSEPNKLPQLQHVLMRIWQLAYDKNSSSTILTLTHYKEIGGLENALSQHADKAYDELDPIQQKIAKTLFCSLSEKDIRRPVKLKEVARLAKVSWKEVAKVVEIFRSKGRNFLTPLDKYLAPNDVIDIIHESLIRQWKRLQKWTEEENKNAKTYQRLEDNACRWKEGKTELLAGIELDNVLEWYKKTNPTKEWAKRYSKKDNECFEITKHFLYKSDKQQRYSKHFKGFLLGISFIVLISLVLYFNGLSEQANTAKQESIIAQERTEHIKETRTSNLFESQLTHAILLARSENYMASKKILRENRGMDSETSKERLQARNLLTWFNKLMGGDAERVYQDVGVPLSTIAVSPDGSLLVTGGENGTLVLFNTNRSSLLQRLQGHTKRIKSVVFHPQGKWFASAGYDKHIIIWSLGKKFEKKLEWKSSEKIRTLAISPDGKFLASAGTDKNIYLWNPNTGELLQTFKGNEKFISGLAFNPDGKILASTSANNVILWDIRIGKVLHTLIGHNAKVQKVVFSPNGKLLASSSVDRTIRLWDANSGKPGHVLIGHKNTVFGIGFIANGRYLVSAGRDNTLRLWDVEFNVTMRVLQEHTAAVTDLAVSNVPNLGEKIFSASSDGTVMRWNYELPHLRQIILPNKKPVSTVISPDGEKVAVGFNDGALSLYSLFDDRLLWEKNEHTGKLKRLAFNSNSTLLSSGSSDSTAKLWQVKDGKLLQTFSGHTDEISAITFSPDDRTIATASYDGKIGLFTVGSEQKYFYPPHNEKDKDVNTVAFNTTDNYKLLSTGDHDIRLWDIKDKPPKLLQEYPSRTNNLVWATLSPDAKQIASVGRTQPMRVYSTVNKFISHRFTGHESTTYRAIFSHDGQQVATISADATLRLWDLYGKGNELFTLRLPTKSGNQNPVKDFDFRRTSKGWWISVPLIGKLMLYNLGDINKGKTIKESVTENFKNKQFIPIPIYAEGPYAEEGTVIFGAFIDYMKMLNFDKESNGINGIKLAWEKCETAYNVDRAIDCYDEYKDFGATGATMFSFVNTDATYAILERATNDKIPVVSIGLGRSDTADGKIFPYMFPLLTTYWNQSTAKIKFIGIQEKGMNNLKGKIIANIYHHSDYGKETIPILERQANKYGFILKHFPIEAPGNEQKSTWEQIKRLAPNWIILRSWGIMTPTALEEAQHVGFPTNHIIGVNWSSSEKEVMKAGKAAKGFITVNFNPSGNQFKVLKDIHQHVYEQGEGYLDKSKLMHLFGSLNYNHGLVTAILNIEAIRIAQNKFGYKPLTGEQVHWGLEHLNLTEKRLKELGAYGLMSSIRTSCADHEGKGKVRFQQWNGEKWNIITDWIEPDYTLTSQLVEAEAKKYANKHGIISRNCAN
ncbi:ABC transporter substrate-binding protein [Candidatus Halobeggiatoa sp. HSG11]|nr:ABC transporter substrate-binding protein [Candidatus Halobeggiatoa sp. HSG11]